MTTLRPKRIGDVPVGLGEYHREFLRKLKEHVEILNGAIRDQSDPSPTPGSQAVTFDDLTPADGEIPGTDILTESEVILWVMALEI